ncbi:hypothetical protein CR492_09960 [Methylocella silvestris]|uniref:Cysteine rich repeat protein n=1 Tax=Methylocella silvestris TaxID=199596 RepID=A0A2J7THF6_METSI|nr:hypothetical protein CR492_09960 [Methylocella silvestris]
MGRAPRAVGTSGSASARAFFAVALLSLWAGAALAQGFEGTAEEREACTPDALSICSSAIPDPTRVKECLIQHVSELSPGCKDVFEQRGKAESERAR